MRTATGDEIKFVERLIRYKLKVRGDDLNMYNPKYLEDLAQKICEEFIRDNPNEPIMRVLTDEEQNK